METFTIPGWDSSEPDYVFEGSFENALAEFKAEGNDDEDSFLEWALENLIRADDNDELDQSFF